MIVHSSEPLNAEPPLDLLRRHFVTAQDDFYVRCHGPIPQLSADTHRLRVRGRVARPLELTLAELRAMLPARTVTAVVQCAGNRRADLAAVRPVPGDLWAPGAIGNAEWTGVALAELLDVASADGAPALHVAFAGCDDCALDGRTFRYGVSIPMHKARAPDVLLAWAMNGEALAPEHGFPLRAVVPGFAGVRSAKWLTGISVQPEPADTPIQAQEYHLFPPGVTAQSADPAQGLVIDDMPLNSAICEPAPHTALPAGPVALRGYAYAAVRPVARVDVSADQGRTWTQARLRRGPRWSWVFWEATLDLPRGEHVLAVRACDTAGQVQPATPDQVWNFKGYLCTSWHRVPVRVD